MKMSANSRMTQLSRELNKKGWKSKEYAGWESDSSDLLSLEIDPTPSQGLQKQNGHVAQHLKFGGNGERENEAEDQTDSEDEPPRKQPDLKIIRKKILMKQTVPVRLIRHWLYSSRKSRILTRN